MKEILAALVMRKSPPASFIEIGLAEFKAHPFGASLIWKREAVLKLDGDVLRELNELLHGCGCRAKGEGSCA
ncbi:hypothetical protein HTY52_12915 [Cupriavidus taiwanensis]|uniref:hypothetical protein n=1 Tax=Cupriavidus taiwanensis TaxID=164546 RepID=UPI00157474D7|nr:hypothetical protein [Cupriavidus taiwanensis]NSX14977.1 hypothetical protein [Cupriavidus taiwanensis]